MSRSSMYELAGDYRQRGIDSCTEQQAERAAEATEYCATRHQRQVGTGYFDEVPLVLSGGTATALAVRQSSEAHPFCTNLANLANRDTIACEVTMKVNMLEAKSQLSRLVKAALEGQEVVIASNGTPMVRLAPIARKGRLTGWGRLKRFADAVDAAFTPEVDAEVARSLEARR